LKHSYKVIEYEDSTGIWTVEGKSEAREFSTLFAAVAPAETMDDSTLSYHACVILAAGETGNITILHEMQDPQIDDFLSRLTDIKDEFRVKRILTFPDNEGFVKMLRSHDGLCHYKIAGRGLDGLLPRRDPDHWPHFVGYDHVAYIAYFGRNLLLEEDLTLQRALHLTSQSRVSVISHCVSALRAQHMRYEEGRKNPLVRAMSFGIVTLDRETHKEKRGIKYDKQRKAELYPNRW
jgi:hypothetical protein